MGVADVQDHRAAQAGPVVGQLAHHRGDAPILAAAVQDCAAQPLGHAHPLLARTAVPGDRADHHPAQDGRVESPQGQLAIAQDPSRQHHRVGEGQPHFVVGGQVDLVVGAHSRALMI